MDDFGLSWYYKDSYSIYQCLYSLQKASSHLHKRWIGNICILIRNRQSSTCYFHSNPRIVIFFLYTLYKWPSRYASRYVTGNSLSIMKKNGNVFFLQIIESSDQNTTDSSNQQKETKKSTNKVKFLWKWIKILLKFLPWFFFYLCQVISPPIKRILLFTLKFKLHRVPLSYVK